MKLSTFHQNTLLIANEMLILYLKDTENFCLSISAKDFSVDNNKRKL